MRLDHLLSRENSPGLKPRVIPMTHRALCARLVLLYRFEGADIPLNSDPLVRTLKTAQNKRSKDEAKEETTKYRLRKIKQIRAQGGCQGTRRRRKTWQAAKSPEEPQAGIDTGISEWGNPAGVMPRHREMNT